MIWRSRWNVWLDDFTAAHVRDPRYLDLAAKVQVVANAECDAIFPNQFPAVLRVQTKSGATLEEKVLANRGGPGNPLKAEELQIKFSANAGRRLQPAGVQALIAAISQLEQHPRAHLLHLTTAEMEEL